MRLREAGRHVLGAADRGLGQDVLDANHSLLRRVPVGGRPDEEVAEAAAGEVCELLLYQPVNLINPVPVRGRGGAIKCVHNHHVQCPLLLPCTPSQN